MATAQEKQRPDTGINVYKESLRNIILRILAEGPMHGYEIMKMIERVTKGRWRPAAGTLYPLLEQLREEDLIDVERVENSGVRGGRKVVYRLTDKGWSKLAEILIFKAEYKVDTLIFYIVEGAARLRERGMVEEYREICAKLREGLSRIGLVVSGNCG
ncbi:MAG: PadR family transcriptional regulator [Desulfurococcales archaeon]|nr:PadR family transcriptional regulator [Desulfurococcales archaeon]